MNDEQVIFAILSLEDDEGRAHLAELETALRAAELPLALTQIPDTEPTGGVVGPLVVDRVTVDVEKWEGVVQRHSVPLGNPARTASIIGRASLRLPDLPGALLSVVVNGPRLFGAHLNAKEAAVAMVTYYRNHPVPFTTAQALEQVSQPRRDLRLELTERQVVEALQKLQRLGVLRVENGSQSWRWIDRLYVIGDRDGWA